MKKQLFSVALLLLLLLLMPGTAWADVIYPAPEDFTVGTEVNHLLATLDPGGTVWTDPELLPAGLRLETEETDSGVDVYLRGTPQVAGSFELIIVYNGSSSICPLHILEPPVAGVTVYTLPAQTAYTAGDVLSAEGLSLLVQGENGSSRIVTEGFSLYPTRLEKAGTQRIEVNYQGHLCYFEVEVAPAPEVIEGIGVLTMPEKIVYEPGESLDPRGLSIRVYTNNGTRDVGAEELQCSPLELSQPGTQTITVTYGEKTCSFTVTVLEPEAPATLTISRLPDKLDYTVGEALDPSGMVLLVTGSRDTPEYVSSGYVCDPVSLDSPGNQEIVVRYGELDCRFQVRVSAYVPSVTTAPYPVPTAAPVAPSDSDTAVIVDNTPAPAAPDPQSPAAVRAVEPDRDGGRLVAVIVIAAVLALGVLGVYVFVVNRSGREYFAGALREMFRRRR